jgi:periplasmic protein CpxP/Spy
MRTTQFGLIAALVLGGLLSVGSLATAQEKKPADKEKPPGERERGRPGAREGARPGQREAQPGQRPEMRDRMQQLSEELKLTAEQKAKLKPIFEGEAEKMRALRDDTSLTPEQRRDKYRELREASAAKIKPILTAEQKEKWDKLQEKMRERGGERGGERGPRRN